MEGGVNFDDEHNCGRLRYVRIEYAGYELAPGKELNGLTLAGCGNQTLIENVQVHRGLDDGVEIFGGTVSLRRVVISFAGDDSLDWDRGWRGAAQFIAIFQSDSADEDGSDKTFESDNYKSHPDHAVLSNPVVSNVSAYAGGVSSGLRFKEGTAGRVLNTLLVGYSKAINVSWGTMDNHPIPEEPPFDGENPYLGTGSCMSKVISGDLVVENSWFYTPDLETDADYLPAGDHDDDGLACEEDDDACCAEPGKNCAVFEEIDYFGSESGHNNTFGEDPELNVAVAVIPFQPLEAYPKASSGLASVGVNPRGDEPDAAGDWEFEEVSYIGAFDPDKGSDHWMQGWTAFPE